MEVSLTPIRQIYFNMDNDYRVLSCVLEETTEENIELNQYGTFTLSGTNLNNLNVGQTVCLDITKDEDSKYSASYIVNGYAGVSFVGEIKVDPKHERLLLEQIMTKEQAKNVNKAYPNFVELVLNNRTEEIDPKNIFNVGDFRLSEYCTKIMENFGVFLFLTKTKTYNISDFNIVSKLYFAYKDSEFWEKEYNTDPYKILMKFTKWSFNRIDKVILSAMPKFKGSEIRAKYCIYNYLKENENEGDTRIDARVLREIIEEEYPEIVSFVAPIIKTDEKIYFDIDTKYCGFKNTFESEKNIATNILERINNPIKYDMDWEKFKDVDDFQMTEEQIQICRIANDESIGMMIGSAGSGKSSATKGLVKMLETYGKSYVLLAPTGIAAKRLRESTNRPASTIHKALVTNTLQTVHDYVIIDEMSCVGVHLLSDVFSIIPKTTKVIFICDNAQLASISCGNIVDNILSSKKMPITELTKIFRYGSSGIATIATNTRKGIMGGRNETFADNDYKCVEINADPLAQVVEEYNNLLNEGYNRNDILILCPYNKSKLGTYTINEKIQEAFNPSTNEIVVDVTGKAVKQIHYKVGDRVINTKNDYHALVAEIDDNGEYNVCDKESPIMNGDIGIIRSIKKVSDTYFEIYVQFDEVMIVFTQKEIKNLLLGYCISCHKSQGSQAKAVISVIGKNHKSLVTRNLLYVAVSRAQEKLVEILYKDTVNRGLNNVETVDRSTWLYDMLTSC